MIADHRVLAGRRREGINIDHELIHVDQTGAIGRR
jgi:hypothetical protein